MRISQVLFDGDDTLWACRHNYFIADWACGGIIARELGPDCPPPQKVLELTKQVERAAMAEHGYLFEQFEQAWVETYRQVVEATHLPYLNSVATAIYSAAGSVKRASYPVFPETHDILLEIRPLVDSIHLISLGDHDFQTTKIKAAGLDHAFDSIHITAGSKQLIMQEIAPADQSIIMVGDNLHTDCDPAIELGIRAAWIHNESLWTQSENGIDPRIHVIHHLRELPDLIRRLS